MKTPLMGRRLLARGIDAFDVAIWDDAIRADPQRMSWVRIHEIMRTGVDNCDVTLEVDEARYRGLGGDTKSPAEMDDIIADVLTEEAFAVSREMAERAEVEGIPEFSPARDDDSMDAGLHWHQVEWSVSDASLIKELIKGQRVVLRRLTPVGRTVWLKVGLPKEFQALAAECDDDMRVADRVYEAIISACGAKQMTHADSGAEHDIPF